MRFIDDLDGSDASGTVGFGLEGKNYEIDLSDDNAAKLRGALAPFIEAGRKAGGRSSGRGRGRVQRQAAEDGPVRSNREDTAAIREWARAHGYKVNDCGRISKGVMEAYKEAQSGGQQSAARVTDPFKAEQVAS